MRKTRIEHDSMGELAVPADALYGASTQRAVENFAISGQAIHPALIHAYGLIKEAAAIANGKIGVLDAALAGSIAAAAREVAEGKHDAHFPSLGSDAALKSRGNLCFFEDVGVEGFFAF